MKTIKQTTASQAKRDATVTVTLRKVRDKSIGVWDGKFLDSGQEKLEFLSRSMCTIEGVDMAEDGELETLVNTEIEVSAPEWLLNRAGLI